MTRLSREELARYRAGVRPRFDAPTDAEVRTLVETYERIDGRLPSTRTQNYLIRLFRIHGREAGPLIERIFRERGTTENLLLLVEIYPRTLGDSPGPPIDAPFTIV